MSSTSVADDIQVVSEGDNSSADQHIDPNVVINPDNGGPGSASDLPSNAGGGSGPDHSRSGSRHRSSEQSQSSPPGGGQECGDRSGLGNQPQNVGSAVNSGGQQQSTPTGGGASGDSPQTSAPNDRQDGERERAGT